MINDHTLGRFAALDAGLVVPLYDGYSFASLPATIHYLLTGEVTGPLVPPDCFGGSYPRPERVALVFVDSFGWEFWQEYGACSRLLDRVRRDGVVTPISTLFPSTTSASVTTLNLGTLPAAHAVVEWNLYVPAYGETIQSLPFALLGGKPGSAAMKGFDPERLVVGRETAHHRLARAGVRSISLGHASYAGSPYNRIASAGAEVRPYTTLAEGLVGLRAALAHSNGRTFVSYYWAGLDTAAHMHGPGSRVHVAEIRAFWAAFDALLEDFRRAGTMVLFTADHGHVAEPAAGTLYVNEALPWLRDALAVGPTGETVWPNGSPRDMFLHVRPERRADVLGALRDLLGAAAWVATVDEAIAAGLFGPLPVPAETRARLGDILVLPHLGHFVWWREGTLIQNRLKGHHGGLSRAEAVTVLGVLDAS